MADPDVQVDFVGEDDEVEESGRLLVEENDLLDDRYTIAFAVGWTETLSQKESCVTMVEGPK